MKEIIELNKRLLHDAEGVLSDGPLMLAREYSPKEFQLLPVESRELIDVVRAGLNEVVPDDFDYLLWLGRDDPSLRLQYDNGAATTGGRGHDWDNARSVFEQLRELDWDDDRQWCMQASETFDGIIAIAKELPEMVPPTKFLQKRLADPVRDYIKQKRVDSSRVHALLWDCDQNLVDNDFEDLAAFTHDLPDIMTCMLHVLTVVVDGKPLPAEKIDGLKTAALKALEDMPISHAKASGKFAYIMAQDSPERP